MTNMAPQWAERSRYSSTAVDTFSLDGHPQSLTERSLCPPSLCCAHAPCLLLNEAEEVSASAVSHPKAKYSTQACSCRGIYIRTLCFGFGTTRYHQVSGTVYIYVCIKESLAAPPPPPSDAVVILVMKTKESGTRLYSLSGGLSMQNKCCCCVRIY